AIFPAAPAVPTAAPPISPAAPAVQPAAVVTQPAGESTPLAGSTVPPAGGDSGVSGGTVLLAGAAPGAAGEVGGAAGQAGGAAGEGVGAVVAEAGRGAAANRRRPPGRPLPRPLSRASTTPPPRTGEGRHHPAPKTARQKSQTVLSFSGGGALSRSGWGGGGTRGGGSGRGRVGGPSRHRRRFPPRHPESVDGRQMCADPVQNGGDVHEDLLVLETQDTKAAGGEPAIPLLILGVSEVMAPVDFHHHAMAQAGEIHDELSNRCLTAEFGPLRTPAQVAPEDLFRRRHRPAHLPRHLAQN